MTYPDYAAFPERPPSEVEWEELLVRYELAPRALRLAVDDAGPGREPEVRRALEGAVEAELTTATLLERMAAKAEGREPTAAAFADFMVLAMRDRADALAQGLAAVRARSFAALQRRGIAVWAWGVDEEGTRITPYRLLLGAVAVDGRVLAAVRAAARGAGAC